MELNIRCSTWIKEDDEKVLEILQKSDKMLSVEELAERTGLPAHKVKHTLTMLAHQTRDAGKLKEFLSE